MIGVFTIPVGDLMHDLRQDREKELQTIKNILFEINNGMPVPNYSSDY